jgi:hypothetical protein
MRMRGYLRGLLCRKGRIAMDRPVGLSCRPGQVGGEVTTLTRPIKRSLIVPTISRPVIIEIDPETKTLGFHERGCRKVYRLPIKTAYMMAVLTEEK